MAMPASAGTSASTPYTRRPVAPFGACRPATSSTSASAAKAMRWKMHSGHGCRFHWNCEKIAKPTSATHAAKPARHWLRNDQREGFRVTAGRLRCSDRGRWSPAAGTDVVVGKSEYVRLDPGG